MKESIKVENVMGGTISDVEIKMPEMLSMIEWVDSNKQELLLLNDLHGHGQGDCCLDYHQGTGMERVRVRQPTVKHVGC